MRDPGLNKECLLGLESGTPTSWRREVRRRNICGIQVRWGIGALELEEQRRRRSAVSLPGFLAVMAYGFLGGVSRVGGHGSQKIDKVAQLRSWE